VLRRLAPVFLLLSAPAFAPSFSPAFAQGPAPGVPTTAQRAQMPRPKAWTLGVGFAPVYSPVWQGSRDSALSLFPDLRLNYRDTLFFSIPDGLGWNAINQDSWKIGPLFKFRFRRNENTGGSPFLITGGSTALQGMGDVGFAGEAGGFAQYSFIENKFKLRAEVRQGFGGHDGLVADTNFSYSDRIGTPGTNGLWLYSVGVRSSFGGAGFTNAYFGVNAEQAAATGLAEYRTGGGRVSSGINGSITKPLGRRGEKGALTLFTGYDNLGRTVADSSLIEERGQRSQFSAGLSYGYRFSWD